ncbi:hypothetical protein [Flavobacterium psychrophilum]|uniref:hypothetical protein n=1 Tax=Flavobacterium psychrophilum TaxID=96345 RepID=UPI001069F6D9|nr:hypothetical protein [Flavobacterium psychrophilum]
MKKKALLLGAVFVSSLTQAQGVIDLQGPANEIATQVKGIVTPILGIAFIIACFANAKHFYGENADIKKGIINIVLFAVIIGVIYGIIRWVFSQHL